MLWHWEFVYIMRKQNQHEFTLTLSLRWLTLVSHLLCTLSANGKQEGCSAGTARACTQGALSEGWTVWNQQEVLTLPGSGSHTEAWRRKGRKWCSGRRLGSWVAWQEPQSWRAQPQAGLSVNRKWENINSSVAVLACSSQAPHFPHHWLNPSRGERWGNEGPERSRDFPGITQPVAAVVPAWQQANVRYHDLIHWFSCWWRTVSEANGYSS